MTPGIIPEPSANPPQPEANLPSAPTRHSAAASATANEGALTVPKIRRSAIELPEAVRTQLTVAGIVDRKTLNIVRKAINNGELAEHCRK